MEVSGCWVEWCLKKVLDKGVGEKYDVVEWVDFWEIVEEVWDIMVGVGELGGRILVGEGVVRDDGIEMVYVMWVVVEYVGRNVVKWKMRIWGGRG